MAEIIYKNKNLVIAYKPEGVPVQPDKSGSADFLSMLSAELRAMGEPSEVYLVHRLDRVVGGLLVFARNKKTAASLSSLVTDMMNKEYLAVIEGECTDGEMQDYLYKNSTLSKAFVVDGSHRDAKKAVLSYTALECVDTPKGKRTLVKISLQTGRFHQIRAQFSSRNLPLVGDGKYGSKDRSIHAPALFAYRISFSAGEDIEAVRMPDVGSYPWNLFREESFLKC